MALETIPWKTDCDAKDFQLQIIKGRRTIENTYGLLEQDDEIVHTPVHVSVENVQNYILVFLTLPNYLKLTENALDYPIGFLDGVDGILLDFFIVSMAPINSRMVMIYSKK